MKTRFHTIRFCRRGEARERVIASTCIRVLIGAAARVKKAQIETQNTVKTHAWQASNAA
jgi:hypothetical protein